MVEICVLDHHRMRSRLIYLTFMSIWLIVTRSNIRSLAHPTHTRSLIDVMSDNTILSSPFFRHDIIDKAITVTSPSDHKTMLALLASKIRLYEDDLALPTPPSSESELMGNLLQTRIRYTRYLITDVQLNKAESEASKLLQYCRDIDRRNEREQHGLPPRDPQTVELANRTQVIVLDLLVEIDGSLGKQGRVRRWMEQKSKLVERIGESTT
jgi:hypothetical protein